MSHFTTLETQIVSAAHLAQALKAMGFPEVEVHDEPQTLFGVEGFARDLRAEIIVRRQHVGEASNDLGFQRLPDGRFRAIISDWDLRHYDARWLQTLTQRYAYYVAVDTLQEQGFAIASEEVEADRTVRLVARRMGG